MGYSRGQLIEMLTMAAELEHMLCCSYLFAAFSTRRSGADFAGDGDPTPRDLEHASLVIEWTQTVSFVARQEMEHLGLVNNLLVAIGGVPHFRQPNFPFCEKHFQMPITLEPLSLETIERFIHFEKPEDLTLRPLPLIANQVGDPASPSPLVFTSFGMLYRSIRWAIENFPGGDAALFIGPPQGQVDGAQLNIDFPRLGELGGVYGITLFPITDTASAVRAIDLIIEQGEGGGLEPLRPPGDPETGLDAEADHYDRFLAIRAQMQKLADAGDGFAPAHNLLHNPVLYVEKAPPGANRVSAEPARKVMDLFNAAYETTLRLLTQLYSGANFDAQEAAALRYAAFFPMMTMVIRPLGEILVTLPARDPDDGTRAGPSFETYTSLGVVSDHASARIVLQELFDEMAGKCRRLSTAGIHPRLGYVAESLALIAARYRNMTAPRGD